MKIRETIVIIAEITVVSQLRQFSITAIYLLSTFEVLVSVEEERALAVNRVIQFIKHPSLSKFRIPNQKMKAYLLDRGVIPEIVEHAVFLVPLLNFPAECDINRNKESFY